MFLIIVGFETAVMLKLEYMSKEIANIRQHQEETTTFLLENKVVNACTTPKMNIQKKYNVILPLKTMDKLDKFNRKLKDKFFKNDIVSQHFYSYS